MSVRSWRRRASRSPTFTSSKAGLSPLSVITSKGHRIEVGMIGSEGMTGLAVVLADGRSRNQTIVQSAGSAMRLSARSLAEAVAASRTLTFAILRYAHLFMLQNTQTALANGAAGWMKGSPAGC